MVRQVDRYLAQLLARDDYFHDAMGNTYQKELVFIRFT